MRGFLLLVVLLLFVVAIMTGIIYATSDSQSTSVHFDKNRLNQVEAEAADATHKAVDRVKEKVNEYRAESKPTEPVPPSTVSPTVPSTTAVPQPVNPPVTAQPTPVPQTQLR